MEPLRYWIFILLKLRMLNKLLFLTGHRKSGTTMFANLFDDHDDFLVYPSDICLLYAYFPYFIKQKFTYKVKKKRILHIVKKDLSSVIKENKIENMFSLPKMLKLIEEKLNKKNINDIRKILTIVFSSFEKSLNVKKKYKYFVVKETSADIFLNKIFKKTDKIKFLHLIRDPRDNYASLKSGVKKYYQKLGENENKTLFSLINRAKLDFNFIEINKKLFGKKNYKEIKFEKLAHNPKKTMKNICKFLDVKFHLNLLKPTILGKNTKGNNYEGESFYNISSKNVNRWKDRINKREAQLIEFYFQNEMKKFKYKLSQDLKNLDHKTLTEFYEWTNYTYFYYDSFQK